jgi:hypothetical protein
MSYGGGADSDAPHRVLRRTGLRGRRIVVQGYQVRTAARAPADRDPDRASGNAPLAGGGPRVRARPNGAMCPATTSACLTNR